MVIFLDASLFCAYKNLDDVHHDASVKIIESIRNKNHGHPVTTEYIFDETVTVLLRKTNKSIAVDIGDFILNSGIFVSAINKVVFDLAWDLFRNGGNLSFTDCTNIAFMKTYGIEKIATFDKGFKEIKGIDVVDK